MTCTSVWEEIQLPGSTWLCSPLGILKCRCAKFLLCTSGGICTTSGISQWKRPDVCPVIVDIAPAHPFKTGTATFPSFASWKSPAFGGPATKLVINTSGIGLTAPHGEKGGHCRGLSIYPGLGRSTALGCSWVL